jgi:hypothetical protein
MLNQNLFSALFPYLGPKKPSADVLSQPEEQPQDVAAPVLSPSGPSFIPLAPGFQPPSQPVAEQPVSVSDDAPSSDTSNKQISGQIPMETQARTALSMVPGSTLSADAAKPPTSKELKEIEKERNRPVFTPPNPNPTTARQRAENRQAEIEFNIANPQNQDHGIKGFLKEGLANFFEGLKYAQPGMGLGQSLALGATGVGAGAISRGWNEKRAAEAALPGAIRQTEAARQAENDQAKIANEQNVITNRNQQTQLDIAKNDRDNLSFAQKPYLDQWEKRVLFDPENNADDKAFQAEALKNGVHLTAKVPNAHYTAVVAPNGNVVVTNTNTGEYKVGNESLEKPKEITEKDLNPAEFGLKTDKELQNMAAAKIAPSMKDRQVRPDVLAALPAEYKNPDGSFNEQAYLSDANLGISKLNAGDIYQNLPDDYKQREAKEIATAQKSQGGLQKQYSRFLSILNHRTPNPNAEPMSLDDVKEYFKKALASTPQQLEEFYKIIAHANIK